MNKKLLLISVVLFWSSFYLFSQTAKAADDGDWWLQREIRLQQNREDYARRVYGSARHTYDVVDPSTSKVKTITKSVVIEDVPSKGRVGKVLLERAKKFKGGIAGVLGGAAITGLIEAVGWVMEDGAYVKYKDQEYPPDEFDYCYTPTGGQLTCYATVGEAGREYVKYRDSIDKTYSWKYDHVQPNPPQVYFQRCDRIKPDSCIKTEYNNLTKRKKELDKPEREKVTLTADDVGGIVTGNYKDPVDSKYDITDNIYKPALEDAYQHDPTGTGNEIANEVDDRIRNAPPTPDGKPAPPGDPKYKNPPSADGKGNDRSWGDDAGKAEGDTAPKTDPTTGEKIPGESSISLQFPVFCEWAHTMCKWYDDWKLSDKRDAKFQEDLTKHNTEEKTFWQTVKDWFTWTREEPELKDESLEVDQENPLGYERLNYVQFGQTCPFSPQHYVLPMGLGVMEFEADASILCQYAAIARPFIIGIGHLGCLIYLLYALRSGSA